MTNPATHKSPSLLGLKYSLSGPWKTGRKPCQSNSFTIWWMPKNSRTLWYWTVVHVFSHYPMPMCNRSPSRQTVHLDPGRDSKKGCKLNSIDYVSKVRQQKIGTSPDIMSLKKQKTKIQKRIFFTNSSPKVQIGRMSQELRLSSNSEESEREVATSKSQLIHISHCWPEVRALRTFLRLRRPCGSAHGGLERWRAEKGEREEWKRKQRNQLSRNHKKIDTINETLNHILPSKSGVEWDGTKLEKPRREKRFISVVPLWKWDKMKTRTIYLVPNLGGHDFLQMIPNIPSARKEKREMVVAFECTKKSPGVHRFLEKKRKHSRNSSA